MFNTEQLHSFHMLIRWCSKFSRLGFSNMWTENVQIYQLDLEKAEEQRSNCQHPVDHRKSKRIPKNSIFFCFIDYTKAFDCVDHNKLWQILKQMGIPDHVICLLRNLYADQVTTVRIGHGTAAGSKLGKEYVKAVYCYPAYLTYMQNTSYKMPANLENSAVATGLEKVSFHSNRKEKQCQRMFKLLHSCTHFTC